MSRWHLKIVIPLLLVIAGSLAQASTGIYKWVDADGNLHFSDCPPDPEEKCKVEEVTVDSGPALSEEELRRIAARRAEWAQELHERSEAKLKQEKEERAEKRAARAQEAEFNEQQCNLARNNLAELLRAEPVLLYEGRTRVVPQREEEIRKDMETMQEIIDQYCED